MSKKLNQALFFTWMITLIGFQGAARAQSSSASWQKKILKQLENQIKKQEKEIRSEQNKLKELQGKVEQLQKKSASVPPKSTSGKNFVRVPKGFKVKLYGFVRGDVFSDSHRTNFSEGPSFVLSPKDPSFKQQQTGELSFTGRYTRIGLSITSPSLPGGWKPSGIVDFDFANVLSVPGDLNPDITSRSKPAARLHLAYARIHKGPLYFEFGQDWDLFGQVLPVVDAVPTNMGNLGDIGYRRPQIQIGYTPKLGFQIAGEAGLEGAVDNASLDGSGFISGEASQIPLVSLLLGYNWRSPVSGQPYSFRVWAAQGEQKLAAGAIAGKDRFFTDLIGADFTAPVNSWYLLHGKLWTGSDLADVTGGIGQNINPVTGSAIGSRGGWIEMGFGVTKNYWVYPGYFLDNPFAGDFLPSQSFARVKNSAWTLAQRFNLGSSLTLGLDYFYWVTDYKAEPPGIDNRFNLFLQEGF